MKLRAYIAVLAATSLAAWGSVASAHHSTAMFDLDKKVTIEGTVKEVQWTNPHIWIQLLVKDASSGKVVEWSLESGPPGGMARMGWHSDSVQPGDHVSMVINPLKDGRPGGLMLSATKNGQPIGHIKF